MTLNNIKKSLPWDEVERQIFKEQNWLRDVIERFHEHDKTAPIVCEECLLRKIAILIVSGKVCVTEITKKFAHNDLWLPNKHSDRRRIFHGSDWHRETISKIESHFLKLGFNVAREPNLHRGRADLGVYKKGEKDLLIEVGTISLFKLWLNLETMSKIILLIVPNDDKLIEFVMY